MWFNLYSDTKSGKMTAFRIIAGGVIGAMLWLSGPRAALAGVLIKPYSPKPFTSLKAGLTQTPNAALQARIALKEIAERAKLSARPTPAVRPLSDKEMQAATGRGPYRNKYLAGAPLPWHRSFHDVNLCTGSLFKSFTDFQIAPARGAGLVLQRTYSSQDERVGAFGVGWTHAYDIRMDETTETDPTTGDEIVNRTDFFGGKHKYSRDADGLYTPPPYMFDEMDSKFDVFLANGPTPEQARVLEDTQKGMDGTVKHFVPDGIDASNVPSRSRVCDTITDRHGNTTTLAYNSVSFPDGSTKKLLSSVTDPSGRVLSFTWANKGTTSAPAYRITQVAGPTGTYRVTYEYNTDLNLSAVHLDADGLNRTTTYGYTSVSGTNGTDSGLLSSITDPLNHSVSYTYDVVIPHNDGGNYPNPYPTPTGSAWVTSITEPAGVDTTNAPRTITYKTYVCYDNGTRITDVQATDSAYNAVVPNVTVDNMLRVTSVGSYNIPRYQMYGFTYDQFNNITQSTHTSFIPNGAVTGTQPSYSPSNTYSVTTSTYGSIGNVLTQTVIGFSGTVTTTYYDASKYFQKASVTDALGRTSTFDYYGKNDGDTNAGNLGEVRWVRDAGYAVTGSSSQGKQFNYTYNNYGQKASETDLAGTVTNYTYGDTWGNLTQVVRDYGTGKLNRTTGMVYDIMGRVTSSTDASNLTSTFTYNALGQPTYTSFPARGSATGEALSFTYGTNGRTESVTDGRGTTTLAYENGSDRVSSVTDPVTGTVSHTYGRMGEKQSMTLPTGDVYQYKYVTSFAYGGSMGVRGTLLPKDDPNSVGLIPSKMIGPGGQTVEIGTAMDGRLYRVSYNITYDASGNRVSLNDTYYTPEMSTQSGNTDKTRGAIAQVSTGWYVKSGSSYTSTLQAQNDYTYNDAGQRTQNAISGTAPGIRTEAYGYDELSRLKTVNYGDGETQTYGFDSMGNRATKSDTVSGSGTTSETYAYDNLNQLGSRTVNGTASTYTNDTVGNTLTGGGRVNTWDSQNRLVQCAYNGKNTAFTYGSDGLRRRMLVTNTDGSQTRTDYVLDGTSVVAESVSQRANATSSWVNGGVASYLMGPSGPLYKKFGSNATDVRWYLYDGLGSVVGEVDVNGLVTSAKKFDVYGATRASSGSSVSRQGWVGGLGHVADDETGYTYMRARYYDAATGRFVSEDPAGQSDNWFRYCGNDPINQKDANGKNALTVMFAFAFALLLFTNNLLANGSAEEIQQAAIELREFAIWCFEQSTACRKKAGELETRAKSLEGEALVLAQNPLSQNASVYMRQLAGHLEKEAGENIAMSAVYDAMSHSADIAAEILRASTL